MPMEGSNSLRSTPEDRVGRLGDFARFLSREAHVLQRFPALLFQQASNAPDRSAPCEAARARPRDRVRPWIRWRNKPQRTDPCRLTIGAGPGRGLDVSPMTGCILYAEGGVVRIEDPVRRRADVVLEGSDADVGACRFSPDGREVVTCGLDGSMAIWDATTGASLHRLSGLGEISACAFSPDGSRILLGTKSGDLWVAETHGGVESFQPGVCRGVVTACAWSPDGRRLVTASSVGAEIWSDLESTPIARWEEPVDGCGFSLDGSRVLTVGMDAALRVGDAATGALLEERPVTARAANSPHTPGGAGGVVACAISPDGAWLALGCWDCSVRIWDLATLLELQTLTGHGDPVVACAFTPRGEAVVSRDHSGVIKVFDLGAGEDARRAEAHRGLVADLLISRDGRRLVSGSWDDTWKVWDVGGAGCLATVPRTSPSDPPAEYGPWNLVPGAGRHGGESRTDCTVHSPAGDRKAVVAPAGRSLDLLEARTNARVARLEERPAGTRMQGLTRLLGVTACAFSSDGARLAAVSDDRWVKVWNATSGSLELRFPTAGVGTVVASTGPRDLVCGDATGGMYFLRIEDEAWPRGPG